MVLEQEERLGRQGHLEVLEPDRVEDQQGQQVGQLALVSLNGWD